MENIKNVLDYTKDELVLLSDEDLKKLLNEAEDKENLYNTKQLVEKLLINSVYGALGNRHFNLFNEDMAAAITGNGRYFIQKLANNIEEVLQKLLQRKDPYIIYGDTDSIYYTIDSFVEIYKNQKPDLNINDYVDWANEFEKKIIQPVIEKTIKDFSEELNAFKPEVIGAEREIISDVGVFSAKKKYYAKVRDSEGTRYPENDPYIKVMGLEIIKSSTPPFSKKYLKKAINVILDKTEMDLKYWIQEVKNEFIKSNIYDIAATSTISITEQTDEKDKNGNLKALTSGTKSALAYNNYIEKNNLLNIYQKISPGDKTKRIHLKLPNKFNSNIIAFNSEKFCKEIEDCVDYDMNFEKNFLNPLQLMVESLNWNILNEVDNEDW